MVNEIIENRYLFEDYLLLGVDVAPGKKSTVCYLDRYNTLQCTDLNAAEMQCLLKKYSEGEDQTLLIWDAPLTGVPLGKINQKKALVDGDCTIRGIEKHYRSTDLPKGISVQGYAGCQHWTITKHLLGLPIMGPYCKTDIPFKHIADQSTKLGKYNVIEAHPALAMYLLLEKKVEDESWFLYKKGKSKKENTANLFGCFLDDPSTWGIKIKDFIGSKENSDHLDAFICWLLGAMF